MSLSHRMMIALLVAAFAMCCAALAPAAAAAGRAEAGGAAAGASWGAWGAWGAWGLHPQDGPDVDLRVQITDQGVTASVTFNLAFADAVVYVPREQTDAVHEVEAPLLGEALFDFLREENTVTIDGVAVAPVLREFEMPEPAVDLLPLFPRTGMRGLIKAHLIVDYPAKSPPQEVSFRWGEFPVDPVLSGGAGGVGSPAAQPAAGAEAEEVKVIIAGQFQTRGASWIAEFTESSPVYTWHRADAPEQRFETVPPPPQIGATLAVPVGAAAIGLAGLAAAGGAFALAPRGRRGVFAGAAALAGVIGAVALRDMGVVEVDDPFAEQVTLSESQAIAAFRPLHTNIYRAFDYNEEGDIYDALARSVDGPLLDELYNQIYRGLVMQLEDGAAVSRVQNVEPVESKLLAVDVEGSGGRSGEGSGGGSGGGVSFRLSHRWQVTGAVYHWGHSHTRTNEYLAEYTVMGTADGWRITQSRPLEQFRVDSTPGAGQEAFEFPDEL